MKSIAIQLFGHLRTFERTNRSLFDNVITSHKQEGYEVDIFIHTWDEIDHSTITWHNETGESPERKLTEDDIKLVKEIYNPKKIIIEKQLETDSRVFTEKLNNVTRSVKAIINSIYSPYKSSLLRQEFQAENNITYDYVIVTRPDIVFNTEFKISNFLIPYVYCNLEIPQGALFYAYNPFCRGKIEDHRLITGSDLIYFATPQDIDKATNLYLNWKNFFEEDNFFSSEFSWMQYWKSENLTPIPILYRHGPEFDIIRPQRTIERIAGVNQKIGALLNSRIMEHQVQHKIESAPIIKIKKKNFLKSIFRGLIKVFPYFIAKKILFVKK